MFDYMPKSRARVLQLSVPGSSAHSDSLDLIELHESVEGLNDGRFDYLCFPDLL